ncbi:hypothetical protein BD410DRAFT_723580 [Rickenella mellea]|uniref:Uncharacterized protein n=1 Tax=Rickenella mellea TaxID=50990 RepID=A0A4Y7Q5D6_9AGAM|nr:hypothetical protein BD410DRAFT_723580 [Rickenella mellea]
MWTGDWWWKMQDLLPEGATISPVILSTDKTQLTLFSGSKQAYPVYLTIGNLPRSIRRKPSQQACILLAYLSAEKITSSNLTESQKRARMHQLFHESMRIVLKPLIEAGKKGVEMVNGKGDVHRVHPILACYSADYPEQCLVTGVKSTTCPKCYADFQDLGHNELNTSLRSGQRTLASLDTALNHPRRQFHTVCQDSSHHLSGYVPDPFWSQLPYTNIHMAITPDILHQLYQGVISHLLSWCQDIIGADELDNQVKRFPPSHGIRHFKNGFTILSNVSGPERKQMAKLLLGIMAGAAPKDVIRCCRALLDFTFIA